VEQKASHSYVRVPWNLRAGALAIVVVGLLLVGEGVFLVAAA
jgi:hypothetical protein